MRKVDGLSLIFIDFYVPALTPRLNSTETSLQPSENINVFAICRIYTDAISKETYIDTRCSGLIIYIYIYTVQCGRQDGTLWHLCLYIPWRRYFTFHLRTKLLIFSEKERRQ
jgi:hypothetical protein